MRLWFYLYRGSFCASWFWSAWGVSSGSSASGQNSLSKVTVNIWLNSSRKAEGRSLGRVGGGEKSSIFLSGAVSYRVNGLWPVLENSRRMTWPAVVVWMGRVVQWDGLRGRSQWRGCGYCPSLNYNNCHIQERCTHDHALPYGPSILPLNSSCFLIKYRSPSLHH
jgi:hypothetical protein